MKLLSQSRSRMAFNRGQANYDSMQHPDYWTDRIDDDPDDPDDAGHVPDCGGENSDE